jgi:hypothetical protein
MSRLKLRHPSPSLAIAIVALVLSLGGTAVAARHYLVTNAKQISPAALKQLTDIAASKAAKQATGAPGAPGPQGAPGKGLAGPAGEKGPEGEPWHGGGWAVVNGDGTLARSNNAAVESEQLGEAGEEGTYVVSFGRDVTSCAYEASIGLSGTENTAYPGFVTVVRWSEQAESVLVQTYNPAGTAANLGFHLAVFC